MREGGRAADSSKSDSLQGSGTSPKIMRRIAAPMVGGMLSAIILTLVVLPAVFLVWKSRLLARETGKLIK